MGAKREKGVVLLSAIIVLMFLAMIGLSLIALVLSRSLSVEFEIKRLKAFYLAEAAISMSLNELKKDIDPDDLGRGSIAPTKFEGGTYEAFIDKKTGVITGIGEFDGVRREIEVKYRIL